VLDLFTVVPVLPTGEGSMDGWIKKRFPFN